MRRVAELAHQRHRARRHQVERATVEPVPDGAIHLADAAGRVVWHRLEGDIIPAIIQVKVLNPGDMFELSHTWDQRTNRGKAVVPGLYTAQGIVLTDSPEPLASPPKPLLIVPA